MSTSLVKDCVIAIPITVLYLLFVNKIIEVLTENKLAEERIKKNIIYSFVIGLLGIVIGIYIFGRTQVKNRPVKISLVFGSLVLIIYSLYNNWNSLQSDSKLFIIGAIFMALIAISYFR